jgi:hypothetical protein
MDYELIGFKNDINTEEFKDLVIYFFDGLIKVFKTLLEDTMEEDEIYEMLKNVLGTDDMCNLTFFGLFIYCFYKKKFKFSLSDNTDYHLATFSYNIGNKHLDQIITKLFFSNKDNHKIEYLKILFHQLNNMRRVNHNSLYDNELQLYNIIKNSFARDEKFGVICPEIKDLHYRNIFSFIILNLFQINSDIKLNKFFNNNIYSDNKIYIIFLIFLSYIIFNEIVKNQIIINGRILNGYTTEKDILEYFQLCINNTCKLINNDFVESEKLSEEKYDLTKEYIELLYSKMNNLLFNYDFKNKFYDYQTDNFKEQLKIQKELSDKLKTTEINKDRLEVLKKEIGKSVKSLRRDEVLLEKIKLEEQKKIKEEEQRKKIEDEKNRELKKKQEEDEKKKQEEMRLKRIEDKKLQKIKAIVDRDQSAGGKNQSKKRKNKLTKNNNKNKNNNNKNNRKKRSLKN